MWVEDITSVLNLKFSCYKSSPFLWACIWYWKSSKLSSWEKTERRAKKQKSSINDLPNTWGTFRDCKLTWTRPNFLQISERTGPIEKVVQCVQHHEPLYLCSPYWYLLISICFLFITHVSLAEWHILLLSWAFQSVSLLTLLLIKVLLLRYLYRNCNFVVHRMSRFRLYQMGTG